MDRYLIIRQCLGSIAPVSIILIPGGKKISFFKWKAIRGSKNDVLGILKEWFVANRLYEDRDGSILPPYSLLLVQHLTNTGH